MAREYPDRLDHDNQPPWARAASADDSAGLADALRTGRAGAAEAFYDCYAAHVRRVLVRVLGLDAELPDLLNEVFLQALRQTGSIRDPDRLKAWLTSIAVFTARGTIRRRARWRWLRPVPTDVLDALPTTPVSHEAREALRATYAVLDKLPHDERIAFALRFIDSMELAEVADACRVSVATVKRRLVRAKKRFASIADRYPALAGYVRDKFQEPPR